MAANQSALEKNEEDIDVTLPRCEHIGLEAQALKIQGVLCGSGPHTTR